jgi:tetratricopeptide (TPR) repeat protein
MPTKLSRFCEGIIEAAWITAIILIPVFFNVYSSRIFEPDKIAILRSLALLILGAWIVKLVEEGKPFLSESKVSGSWLQALLRTPLLPQALLLAAIYIIATIFSVSPRASLWGSYQRLQGTYTLLSYLVIFGGLVATLRRREQIDRLITMLVITSLPVVFYGFLQRYELDPIAWGGDTTTRIAANLGNSIFVAAYLVMVWPLTIMRTISAFRSILKSEQRMGFQIARAAFYLLLALLQPVAMYFSGSRGPLLGFGASALFLLMLYFILMVPAPSIRRIVVSGILLLGIVGASGLLLLNIEDGPLQSLRESPLLGRFALLLNPESNSALVREYIWEGAAELVAPHAPISYPDGSTDAFNFLRPLIGYGPESMYVAFNPFYVPDLGHVEKRNASPDRSHNETWDSLVITGALGFLIYTILFISVFYYGFQWLGLIMTRLQKRLFWLTTLGGGVIGSALLIAWGGIEWFGLGFPFGVVIGLVFLFLPAVAFTQYDLPASPAATARALLIIALLSAILAHYLEINFGIAIAVTRTYFWIYAALLLLSGVILPSRGVFQDISVTVPTSEQTEKSSTAQAVSQPKAAKSSRKRKPEKQAVRNLVSTKQPWIMEAVLGGLFLAVLLSALGYNYIANSNRNMTVPGILTDALTVLPSQGDAQSFGILGLVLVTLLVGALLFTSENERVSDWRLGLRAFGVTFGIASTAALVFWLWRASALASLARFTAASLDELVDQVNRISSLLTNFYLWVALLLFAAGYVLSREHLPRQREQKFGLAVAAGIGIAVALLAVVTNLRVIHADITFKMAEPFATGSTWNIASLLYQRSISLAPEEDYYYLFLGRSYLEQAKSLENEQEKQALVQRAEKDLKQAQSINPLNTDHTANLGRLFTWWAGQTTEAGDRLARAQTANSYYARALMLSPNNSTLRGEWAILQMDLLNQPDAALENLQIAISLDEEYNFTQGLLGDYYLSLASQLSDPTEIERAYQNAIDYYAKAVEYSVGRDRSGKYQYLLSQGNAFVQWGTGKTPLDQGHLMSGIQYYKQANELQPNSSDAWRVNEQIARIYSLLEDKENALFYAEVAMKIVPDDYKIRIAELIQQIEALP